MRNWGVRITATLISRKHYIPTHKTTLLKHLMYNIHTTYRDMWKEKFDNTSYLRLFQACTQPHTFQFPENFKLKYLDQNAMYINTQKKERETPDKAFWLGQFSGNMFLFFKYSDNLKFESVILSQFHSQLSFHKPGIFLWQKNQEKS